MRKNAIRLARKPHLPYDARTKYSKSAVTESVSARTKNEVKRTSDKAILNKLKQIPFFLSNSESELRQIAAIMTECSYEAGEIIIQENSTAEEFFIIHRGKIQISKTFEDGEEVMLGVYSNGEFFGEMAILDEGPRSANARAVEPTTVMVVSYKDFERLLGAAPQIAYAIMKELSARLRETGALLVWELTRKNRELGEAYLDTVKTLVRAIEQRDRYIVGHSDRVAKVAVAIGKKMSLPEQELRDLELGGLLHDVGMIGVSESILRKPDSLIAGELAEVKRHPGEGTRMIEKTPFLRRAIPAVLYHHERFDGSGYPGNVSATDIPLVARIIAVADVFDALTSDRPHRAALDETAALALIREKAGTEFDADVVAALVAVVAPAG